jgi:murein DD-endopeptidase MepM/ murein hydrolase activator NlpD
VRHHITPGAMINQPLTQSPPGRPRGSPNLLWLKKAAWLGLVALASCISRPDADWITSSPAVSPPAIAEITTTPITVILPNGTIVPEPIIEATVGSKPSTGAAHKVCSPLSRIPIESLPKAVANPYNPPLEGSDNPHQGVDLAEMDQNRFALAGGPLQAVLAGRAVGFIEDRFPYGNGLIIETQLRDISWMKQLDPPVPAPFDHPSPALTCPEAAEDPKWDLSELSLYLLYSHLESPPMFSFGEEIECGQQIGTLGASGNALNPHLHLEARIGPAGRLFDSLSHYNPSATSHEMANYCLWRTSGFFRTIDPMILFSESTEPSP